MALLLEQPVRLILGHAEHRTDVPASAMGPSEPSPRTSVLLLPSILRPMFFLPSQCKDISGVQGGSRAGSLGEASPAHGGTLPFTFPERARKALSKLG